jgi:hypothetical protein
MDNINSRIRLRKAFKDNERYLDLWTAYRPTTTPQAPQPQQKRTFDVLQNPGIINHHICQ